MKKLRGPLEWEGERPASRRSVKQGVHHIARLLLPYHTDAHKTQLLAYLEI